MAASNAAAGGILSSSSSISRVFYGMLAGSTGAMVYSSIGDGVGRTLRKTGNVLQRIIEALIGNEESGGAGGSLPATSSDSDNFRVLHEKIADLSKELYFVSRSGRLGASSNARQGVDARPSMGLATLVIGAGACTFAYCACVRVYDS